MLDNIVQLRIQGDRLDTVTYDKLYTHHKTLPQQKNHPRKKLLLHINHVSHIDATHNIIIYT